MKIGIDMGHTLSGAGSSAVGVVKESDKNREVGKRLIAMLQEKNHTVVNCTVDYSENDLADRVSKANAQSLDYFVSLHLNAHANESAHGVETYIYNGSYQGKEANRSFAKRVNDEIVNKIGWYNRGVKEANYYVLRNTIAPAILIELGFCTNKSDMDKWNNEVLARALFKGITGTDYVANGTSNSSSNSTPSSNSSLYRVRKSWSDASNQIGAYSNLDNAKACVDKNPGYAAFDESGKQVYPAVTTSSSCEKVTLAPCQEVGGSGIATITTPSGIIFRDHYCTHCGVKQGTYEYGEEVVYDMKCYTEKYTWISWVSASTGKRRWMPIGDRRTGEKWATVR